MNDKTFLDQAKKDVSRLVSRVVEELKETADLYHYEPSWVMDELKSQLLRVKEI